MVAEIELFQTPNLIPLDFCLWIWMQSEVYNRKIIKRDTFLAPIVNAAARTEKREDQLRRKDAIFTNESRSALKLTVGFLNICGKLQQMFNLDIQLKYN
jgi:hypothetical protein